METNYPSKRDAWLTLVVGLCAVISSVLAVVIWTQPNLGEMRLILSGLFAFETLFIVDLLLRTDYTLGPDELRVRCGLLRWRVPYASIKAVTPGRTWISGPALSIDRITITRSNARLPLIISPEDQERFLGDLAERATTLERIDGALVRRHDPAAVTSAEDST